MSGGQRSKEAFREGFMHALREAERLQGMGFARLDEVVNILEMHAGRGLKAWSLQGGAAYEMTAPKAWTGSTWWEIRAAVFKRDGRRCSVCGSTKRLQIDHIHPVAKGGLPTLDNLQVLCKTCNLQKGAGTLPAKNRCHASRDATCSSHVARATATSHTTPFGGVTCSKACCDIDGCSCNFLQVGNRTSHSQISTNTGDTERHSVDHPHGDPTGFARMRDGADRNDDRRNAKPWERTAHR